MLFRAPRILGMVFDLTLRHYGNKRLVDEVKKSVNTFLKTYDDDDGFYLYHPQLVDVLFKRGEQVSMVANYETDGYKFDLMFALKQTLYVVASEDADSHKTVCLVTDRFEKGQVSYIKKLQSLNNKDSLDCSILVIGVGTGYDKESLQEACKDIATYYHNDNPSQINSELSKWFESLPSE